MPTPLSFADIAAGIQTWIRCESPSSSPPAIAAMVKIVERYENAFSDEMKQSLFTEGGVVLQK